MNQNIKTILMVAGAFALVAFSYAAVQFSSTYSRTINPTSVRNFSVTGEGTILAIPDIARFSFSVITEGKDNVQDLQQENTLAMNGILDAIKLAGVEEKDIRTVSYTVTPQYEYYPCFYERGSCPPPNISGYSISQSIEVTVRDFANAGELLSLAVQKGANSVSQLSFSVDDPTALEDEAREIAILKAKRRATSIALASGFRLGKILEVQEGSFNDQIYPTFMKEGMGGAEDTAAPLLEPGTQEVISRVTLIYEIR